MSQWYYNKDGQAHGPLKIEDMESRIKNGEIGPLDLVFEVGTTEWKALSQVPTLEVFIVKEEPEPEPPPAAPEEGPQEGPPDVPEWVLLKKVKVDGKSQFKQMGPYTKAQILDFIDQGKVLFQDFIWKTGMESWQPVSEVETFQVPLPSSPPLETAIYQVEKSGSTPDESVAKTNETDQSDLASLTELVEIEKYQREKTQMVSAEQLRKQWIQDDAEKAAPESATSKDAGGGDLWSLEPPSVDAPKKSKAVDTRKEKNSLFSLKKTKSAPAPKKEAAVEVQVAAESPEQGPPEDTLKTETPPEEVVPKTISAQQPAQSAKTTKEPKNHDDLTGEMLAPVSGAPLGRFLKIGAALVVFVVATAVLFSSMSSDESVEDVQVAEASEDEGVPPLEEPPPAAAPDSASPEVVKQLQEKLQAYEAKLKDREQQIENKRVARLEKKEKALKQKKEREANRKLASERKTTAKKSTAKPKVKTKVKVAEKAEPAAPIIKRSKASRGGVPGAIGGSFRNRSFYLQRDRKALFYTALDAERLVTDLESSYKDLKRDKSGWKKFYRGWKSRLKSSTPSLIRSFPNSREDYAFPKEIAAFKSDHGLLKDYGDLHNAKVLGLRVPASPGKNLTQTFSRHRSKAKNLGGR